MGNSDTFNPNASRSFLLWWVLANILGLPVLVEMFDSVGNLVFGEAYDRNIGIFGYLIIIALLSKSAGIIGGWLGLMQWLVLRKRFPQALRWILASSIGVVVGTLFHWLQYMLIFAAVPINERHNVVFFSYWYSFVAYGVWLGFALGVSQWLVLKQWVHRATWWIVALPLCFSLGFYFANLYRLEGEFTRSIYMLRQQIAVQFPGISDMQMIDFFAVLSALTVLIGVGLVTGVLLDRLLQFHNKQKAVP